MGDIYTKTHPLIDHITPTSPPHGYAGHHTDQPPTEEDKVIADKLAWYMGTLSELPVCTPQQLWRHYLAQTSADEWVVVVRALRLHGLRIVNVGAD